MLNSMPAHPLPATWAQRLTGVAKTVWDAAGRRPAQPAPAPLVAASQPVLLGMQTILPPARPDVVCLVVEGVLNRHTAHRWPEAGSPQRPYARCVHFRQRISLSKEGYMSHLSNSHRQD